MHSGTGYSITTHESTPALYDDEGGFDLPNLNRSLCICVHPGKEPPERWDSQMKDPRKRFGRVVLLLKSNTSCIDE